MQKYKYLFGPIPSRRLGISLGVDLVKHKVCTLDCVYCEAGKTTCLTTERLEYIPLIELKTELDEFLKDSPKLDFITFSGAGEPTLHSGLGEIAAYIKKSYPQYKIALITNGTLFSNSQVRREVLQFDYILPSLDAVSDTAFHLVNRPDHRLINSQIIDGLIALRKEYPGKILLEVFIIPGLNDNDTEISLLKEVIMRINPDVVQLNTLDRPGTEDWVEKPDREKLELIAEKLLPLPVEIIAKFSKKPLENGYNLDTEFSIIEYLKRRPATMEDLVNGLGKHINEVSKYITHLSDTEYIEKYLINGNVYYRIK